MTQQAMPTAAELYEGAVRSTCKIAAAIQPGQLDNPTPCTEWNVQAVLNHLATGAARALATLSGTEAQEPTGDATAADFADTTTKVLELAKAPGALEKTVTTRRGEVPAGEFLTGSFMDTLIHGWDLAMATGQDTTLPADLVEACYAAFEPRIDKERTGGPFATYVATPEDTSAQVKLLGLLGRTA